MHILLSVISASALCIHANDFKLCGLVKLPVPNCRNGYWLTASWNKERDGIEVSSTVTNAERHLRPKAEEYACSNDFSNKSPLEMSLMVIFSADFPPAIFPVEAFEEVCHLLAMPGLNIDKVEEKLWILIPALSNIWENKYIFMHRGLAPTVCTTSSIFPFAKLFSCLHS
jgi:hypothetical protein